MKQFLLLLGLAIVGYATCKFGAAGLVAGIMILLFFLLGIGPIFMGGGITHGIGGVFAWFLGFVAILVGMFLVERSMNGETPGAYDPATNKHVYFADKVLSVFSNFLSNDGHMATSNGHTGLIICMVISGACILLGLLAKITK